MKDPSSKWESAPSSIEPRAYRTPEASRYVGVSESMLRKLVSLGSLPAVHIGNAVLFLREDLDVLLFGNRGTRR